MDRNPVIPPNFVTLRDLKERRDREQMLTLQRSTQVEKKEESEVKGQLIAPVYRKEDEKEEGSFDNIPPKPRNYTYQNRSSGRGPRRQNATINAKAVTDGSTSNAWEKKKESSAEVAGVITEMSLSGRSSYASEVAMEEKRTKATTALVNGGKRGGHVALDIERRISGLQINWRNSNPLRRGKETGRGRGYGNYWPKNSNSVGKVWVVKKSLNQKDDAAGNK